MGAALVFIQHVTKFRCVLFILGFISRFVAVCLLVVVTVIVGGLCEIMSQVFEFLVAQGKKLVDAQQRAVVEHHEYHRNLLGDDK